MTGDNNGRDNARKGFPRLPLILIAALAICAAAFFGFRKWNSPPPEQNQFYQVKRSDMLISVVEGGALKAVKESIIRSEFEGISRIISIVPEGSYVKAGELRVELDSSRSEERRVGQ